MAKQKGRGLLQTAALGDHRAKLNAFSLRLARLGWETLNSSFVASLQRDDLRLRNRFDFAQGAQDGFPRLAIEVDK